MLRSKIKARMRREMTYEKPTIWIGRNGVTSQFMSELLKQLDKNEIIKMRILRSALKDEDEKYIIQKIVDETDSTLIDQRGHFSSSTSLEKEKSLYKALSEILKEKHQDRLEGLNLAYTLRCPSTDADLQIGKVSKE